MRAAPSSFDIPKNGTLWWIHQRKKSQSSFKHLNSQLSQTFWFPMNSYEVLFFKNRLVQYRKRVAFPINRHSERWWASSSGKFSSSSSFRSQWAGVGPSGRTHWKTKKIHRSPDLMMHSSHFGCPQLQGRHTALSLQNTFFFLMFHLSFLLNFDPPTQKIGNFQFYLQFQAIESAKVCDFFQTL